mgnify:CR=1 FL=1
MRSVPLILLLTLAACDSGTGAARPGPCRAEWSVFKIVNVGGQRFATPFEVGTPRVMYFTYDEGGNLSSIADDQDGDGTIDNQREIELVGASGLGGQRLWSRCQGECVYDDFGNMLVDRDPAGGDSLRYFYDCWQ